MTRRTYLWLAAACLPLLGSCAGIGQQSELDQLVKTCTLPSFTTPPAPNANAAVAKSIAAICAIAENQKLVCDGTRAADGILVIGKAGTKGPMVLAFRVYSQNGEVLMEDSHFCKVEDVTACMTMRSQLMAAMR